MNPILQKLVESASDAASFAKSLNESGLQFVRGAVKGIPIFGSLSALSVSDLERDETHYLLVPFPDTRRNYVVYTKRVIPSGFGATNSLPKARIFHVPDEAGSSLLECELISRAMRDSAVEGKSQLADRLDQFANSIDRESERISGGLLLIGGVASFINPLVGIGIAAHGLLATLGAKATKAGAEYVGDKLRSRNKATEERQLEKETTKVVRQLNPQIEVNPLLRSLDAIVTNPTEPYDPFLDRQNWIDQFPNYRYYQVTLDAIGHVYGNVIAGSEKSPLSPSNLAWIRHLSEMAEHGDPKK